MMESMGYASSQYLRVWRNKYEHAAIGKKLGALGTKLGVSGVRAEGKEGVQQGWVSNMV